jgi:hypothetical protein
MIKLWYPASDQIQTDRNIILRQEVAIMGFGPSYKGQTREEYRVTADVGWLAAVSLAIVVLILV